MKKWAVGFGVIVLLLGLAFISISNTSHTLNIKELVASVENKWIVSGYFKQGENLTIWFTQPKDWAFGPYPEIGEPPYSKHFMVNITNTAANDYTLLKVILMVPQQFTPPGPPYAFSLNLVEIEVEHHGGIIVGDSPLEIGGTIKNDGEYRIKSWLIPPTVIGEDYKPHPVSPPLELRLDMVTNETVYPYTFLLPLGSALSIVGVIISIWGIKSRRRKIARKRRLR